MGRDLGVQGEPRGQVCFALLNRHFSHLSLGLKPNTSAFLSIINKRQCNLCDYFQLALWHVVCGGEEQESCNAGHIWQTLFYSFSICLTAYLLTFSFIYCVFLRQTYSLVKASLELPITLPSVLSAGITNALTLFSDCTYD